MTLARLTSKGQLTVPKSIRKQLHLDEGDTLSFEVEGDSVRMRKLKTFDHGWHQAVAETLEEWNSPEDDEAFSGL